MMKRTVFLLMLFSFSVCMGETLRIAVAANVSYAIGELKRTFENEHPKTTVEVILGSSGKLTAQIKHGAPFDLFMSANMKYPEVLYEEGIAMEKPVIYAQGVLVYLSVKPQDFSKGVMLLKEKKNQKIAIANPKTAPYGIATVEALKNAKVYEEIKNKFVYGESVSQTVTYATKAADIGVVAKSSLFSPQMKQYKQGKNWYDVNSTLYRPISQGMVILRHGKKSKDAKAFYQFMLSQEAQNILKKYGYGFAYAMVKDE